MINLASTVEYLSVVHHFMACTMLLCGFLVWMQRQENFRQRVLLALTLFVCGVGIMVRVLAIYKSGIPSSYLVLPIDELYAGFFIYITYQELYLRLFPAAVEKTGVVAKGIPMAINPETDVSGLWTRLEVYMRVEKLWLLPDITVADVAKIIGVSRSRLSAEISAQGDDSFHTLVARYRIEEFCKMAQQGEIENVNEAFFAVGFRSRSTAYDRFKEQTGMTPAEYIKTIKTGDK